MPIIVLLNKQVIFFFFQAEPAPDTCECHVCKQEASGLPVSAMTAGALPPGHQFMSPEKPTHPALHLYPHIHGHVPLHAVPHLPRPLIHPTLYTAPPFTHSKVSRGRQGTAGEHRTGSSCGTAVRVRGGAAGVSFHHSLLSFWNFEPLRL